MEISWCLIINYKSLPVIDFMSLIPKIHTRTSLDIIFYAKIMETCCENARKPRKIKISNVKRRQTRKSLPDSEAAYTIYFLKNCISEFEAWEFDEISRFLSNFGTVAGEKNFSQKKRSLALEASRMSQWRSLSFISIWCEALSCSLASRGALRAKSGHPLVTGRFSWKSKSWIKWCEALSSMTRRAGIKHSSC